MLRKMFVVLLLASLGGFSAVLVSACGEDDVEEVELSVTERDLSPGRVEVSAGEIEFVVKNDGERTHAFAVETPDGIKRTENIDPGEEARLTVRLTDGKYRMYDPRGGYRARGVRGTVIVGDNADTDTDTDTVTERTVTERTVEEDTVEAPEPEQPPVTVTEREVQPAPRRPRRPPPAPTPPPAPEDAPVEPPPPTPPDSP